MKESRPCRHEAQSGPCLGFHPNLPGQARHGLNYAGRRGTMTCPCDPLGHGPCSPSAISPHIKCDRNPNLAIVARMSHGRTSTPRCYVVLSSLHPPPPLFHCATPSCLLIAASFITIPALEPHRFRLRLEEMMTSTATIGDLEEMAMLPQSQPTEDS
jgi:hypothetical protein